MKTWNNSNIAQNMWVIYTLTAQENTSGKPDFIWYCKAGHVMLMSDAMKNPDFNHNTNYLLEVLEYLPDRMKASNGMTAWLKLNGFPPLNLTQHVNRYNPVKCITTGVTYRNAAEACGALGINRSQMSQHLRHAAGYKTVKGMTFINISSAGGKRVQFPPAQA